MGLLLPLTPLWFRRNRVYRSKSYFESKLQKVLDEHASLPGPGNLSVEVVRDEGLRKPRVRLAGEVEDERARVLAGEVAWQTGRGVIEVVNEIAVGGKSKGRRT